jgi:8-oxo-dGTP pyrophosphatase MutT (NUDIX family)
MKPGKIRPIAICVIRNGARILVAEGYDHVKQQFFYRPLGGAIEFGEQGADAVVREMREEVGAELRNLRFLGTIENIFTYNGEQGHEIVLVYEADFTERAIYDRPSIEAYEDDGAPFKALWKPLDEFDGRAPLYPDGLLDFLAERDTTRTTT